MMIQPHRTPWQSRLERATVYLAAALFVLALLFPPFHFVTKEPLMALYEDYGAFPQPIWEGWPKRPHKVADDANAAVHYRILLTELTFILMGSSALLIASRVWQWKRIPPADRRPAFIQPTGVLAISLLSYFLAQILLTPKISGNDLWNVVMPPPMHGLENEDGDLNAAFRTLESRSKAIDPKGRGVQIVFLSSDHKMPPGFSFSMGAPTLASSMDTLCNLAQLSYLVCDRTALVFSRPKQNTVGTLMFTGKCRDAVTRKVIPKFGMIWVMPPASTNADVFPSTNDTYLATVNISAPRLKFETNTLRVKPDFDGDELTCVVSAPSYKNRIYTLKKNDVLFNQANQLDITLERLPVKSLKPER